MLDTMYAITSPGILFLEDGGYIHRKEKQTLEITKLRREIYWYKDPRYWAGFITASIGAIITHLLRK